MTLDDALTFLANWVAPHASEIDQGGQILAEALKEMGRQRLMALKVPPQYGGPGLDAPALRRYQEECARASGTFAFLQTQHQSGSALILSGENVSLADEYLPKLVTGEKTLGIGFSQLRRPGQPIMTAEATDGGYILKGHVPWATGESYFQEILIGATLPSGEALFAITPFANGQGIALSQPMKLASMEAARTVTMDFDDYFCPQSKVVMIKPNGWIANSDMINIALQGHFAIGCALAGLDVLKTISEKRPSATLIEVLDSLQEELDRCRMETANAQQSFEEETTEDRLKVRAWAIDLAFRCAQAAVVSCSGASNSMQHPAQRIYREALVFSVSAQTTPIRDATLARLVR